MQHFRSNWRDRYSLYNELIDSVIIKLFKFPRDAVGGTYTWVPFHIWMVRIGADLSLMIIDDEAVEVFDKLLFISQTAPQELQKEMIRGDFKAFKPFLDHHQWKGTHLIDDETLSEIIQQR